MNEKPIDPSQLPADLRAALESEFAKLQEIEPQATMTVRVGENLVNMGKVVPGVRPSSARIARGKLRVQAAVDAAMQNHRDLARGVIGG